jgi:hypothetical protein
MMYLLQQTEMRIRVGDYVSYDIFRVSLELELLNVLAQVVDVHVVDHSPLVLFNVHLDNVDYAFAETRMVENLLEGSHAAYDIGVCLASCVSQANTMESPPVESFGIINDLLLGEEKTINSKVQLHSL